MATTSDPAPPPTSSGTDAEGLWTLTRLTEAIRTRAVSSRELLELYLRRIERINPAVNAVVTLAPERAFEEARVADEATARGESSGPLHGVPTTIKDAIETEGIRSTGGANALSDHVPAADAPAVARLRAAGAIVFGKTNLPQWSADFQSYNDLFGTTNNPWDLTRTPGGSSGGAGAAVAAGLSAFEVGTDIGGSVRIPSHFCGVYGHKPSFGIVSQLGYLDHREGGTIKPDINVFGPLARGGEDLDLLLSVLAGPDPGPEAWRLDLPAPRQPDLRSYRVGVWLDDPAAEVDTEVVEILDQAVEALAGAGAHIDRGEPPVAMTEARRLFDGLIMPAIALALDPDVGEALGGSHRTWLQLCIEREAMRQQWAAWFADHDALICPVMPMAAFPHDQRGNLRDRSLVVNGRTRPHGDLLGWTGLVGVAYLPSTVVPVGRTRAGLPVGAQVVGPYLGDRTSIDLATRLGAVVGGYTPPPLA